MAMMNFIFLLVLATVATATSSTYVVCSLCSSANLVREDCNHNVALCADPRRCCSECDTLEHPSIQEAEVCKQFLTHRANGTELHMGLHAAVDTEHAFVYHVNTQIWTDGSCHSSHCCGANVALNFHCEHINVGFNTQAEIDAAAEGEVHRGAGHVDGEMVWTKADDIIAMADELRWTASPNVANNDEGEPNVAAGVFYNFEGRGSTGWELKQTSIHRNDLTFEEGAALAYDTAYGRRLEAGYKSSHVSKPIRSCHRVNVDCSEVRKDHTCNGSDCETNIHCLKHVTKNCNTDTED